MAKAKGKRAKTVRKPKNRNSSSRANTKLFRNPSKFLGLPVRPMVFVMGFANVALALLIITSALTVSLVANFEPKHHSLVNGYRSNYGVAGLKRSKCLTAAARNWAKKMATDGQLRHTNEVYSYWPNYYAQYCPNATQVALGENIYVRGTSPGISGETLAQSSFDAFRNSSGHALNMRDSEFRWVGYGAATVQRNGLYYYYTVQAFANCYEYCTSEWTSAPTEVGSTTTTVEPITHLLRNSNSDGSADIKFNYGQTGDKILYCDWDGNGSDTPGVYRNGTWYLKNTNNDGPSYTSFGFGGPSDTPVCGNWDGIGGDTIGVWSNGTWKLRNSNNGGAPSYQLSWGGSNDKPIVGDWNNDNKDTIGVWNAGNWKLLNNNTGGSPNAQFSFGGSSDKPIVGDWDRDGMDTIGVWNNGTWKLRNSNSGGSPAKQFTWGSGSYVPVTGDWNDDGYDTVGIWQ